MRFLIAVFVVASSLAASAQTPDLEREAREIEAALIAPCCFSQQVSVHQSPAADEARKDIRRRLAAGETRAQILAAYQAQYGKRVLAEPPAEGFDRLLKVVPLLGLVLTAGLVALVVRRFTRRAGAGPSEAPAAAAAGDSRYSEQLDDQLRDLD